MKSWAIGLTTEQRTTVERIRDASKSTAREGTDGWTVYMQPSTGVPHYLELRYRSLNGRVQRWVIERDGSVSATGIDGDLITPLAA